MQSAQAGKATIVADKVRFVQLNGKMPVVLSAISLFAESQAYGASYIEGLSEEIGAQTLAEWIRDPLPAEIREQMDENTVRAGALNGPGLQDELGMTDPNATDPLTTAATDINGLRVEVLGLTEQLDAAASLQLSAMRSADANTYQAEIDRINSIKSSYGTLVSLCKGAVDLASGNWFGPLADAMNGIVGMVADHQSAMVAAQQKSARWDSVHAVMDAGTSLASSATTQLTGLSDQLVAAISGYKTAETEIRDARDSRRDALLTVGANASGEDGDGASADIAARMLLVGTIIESAIQAHYIRQVIASNGLTEDAIRSLWSETYANRENNACAIELKYFYTLEESGGTLLMWNWTHPSEDAAFQSIIDMTTEADQFMEIYLGEFGDYPAGAQALLQSALDGMGAY